MAELCRLAAGALALSLAWPDAAGAAPRLYPCYIQRVETPADTSGEQDGAGVTIHFFRSYRIFVQESEDADMRPVRIGRDRPLRLRAGEAAHILNPHDGCRMNVAVRDGRVGLVAYNWSNDWGAPWAETEIFLPAEPPRRRR